MSKRRKMVLDLVRAAALDGERPALRPLAESDAAALAELMLEAYRGTPDDNGESLDDARGEVRLTFEGGYGRMLWDASFAVEAEPGRGALRSASVITLCGGAPLLAFSLTHPQARRRGLAAALIRESARALALQGHTHLELVVTCGNAPAERLYEKLGFRETERR